MRSAARWTASTLAGLVDAMTITTGRFGELVTGGSLTRSPNRQMHQSHSRLVFPRLGVDADPVAFVDERRDVDDEPRFERRGLDLRARGRALDAGHRLLHDEIDRRRQLDTDRLLFVELDADDGLGDEIVLRVSKGFGRDLNLLVAGRVHEVEVIAVIV